MALKKTELYSSLWASCDELRGGMDASQYKDYVLTFLFMKYVSDKYKDDPIRGKQFMDRAINKLRNYDTIGTVWDIKYSAENNPEAPRGPGENQGAQGQAQG